MINWDDMIKGLLQCFRMAQEELDRRDGPSSYSVGNVQKSFQEYAEDHPLGPQDPAWQLFIYRTFFDPASGENWDDNRILVFRHPDHGDIFIHENVNDDPFYTPLSSLGVVYDAYANSDLENQFNLWKEATEK